MPDADGIKVPIFRNDYWFRGDWNWRIVFFYAFDSFTVWVCLLLPSMVGHALPGIDALGGHSAVGVEYQYPMFVSELQGGTFDPWGGWDSRGCAATLDGDALGAR